MAVLMMAMNLASHGTQDMYPTFLERQWGFQVAGRAGLTAFSMVGAIVGGTLFGFLSDRIGRRRSMVIALLAAVLVIPIWAFSPSVTLLVIGAFVMQFMVQGAWGVVPAHLSELSPDSVAASCRDSVISAACCSPARWVTSRRYSPAATATRWPWRNRRHCVLMAAIATALGPERRAAVWRVCRTAQKRFARPSAAFLRAKQPALLEPARNCFR